MDGVSVVVERAARAVQLGQKPSLGRSRPRCDVWHLPYLQAQPVPLRRGQAALAATSGSVGPGTQIRHAHSPWGNPDTVLLRTGT
jgi:hypothetical protein